MAHTHFDYTNSYQLLKTTFPSTYYETYLFDGNGNLQNKTDRDNQRISYSYDYQNRLVRKFYPDSSTVNYTYDAAGRFTQAQDASGTWLRLRQHGPADGGGHDLYVSVGPAGGEVRLRLRLEPQFDDPIRSRWSLEQSIPYSVHPICQAGFIC